MIADDPLSPRGEKRKGSSAMKQPGSQRRAKAAVPGDISFATEQSRA